MEKYEVGKYYYVKSAYNWIIKVKNISGKKLYGFLLAPDNTCYIEDSYLTTNSIEDSSLATYNEIQWLDVCIAANKFVPKPTEVWTKENIIGVVIDNGYFKYEVINPNNSNSDFGLKCESGNCYYDNTNYYKLNNSIKQVNSGEWKIVSKPESISYKLEDLKGKKYFIRYNTPEKFKSILEIIYGKKASTFDTYKEDNAVSLDDSFAGWTKYQNFLELSYTEIPYDKFIEANSPVSNQGIYSKMTSLKKEDFYDCKIWIGDNQELSEKVQKRFFELGFSWGVNQGKQNLRKEKILFINTSKYTDEDRIFKGYNGDGKESGFKNCPLKEIFPSDLGIEENSPKSFNPSKGTDIYKCYGIDPYDIKPESKEIVIRKIVKKESNKKVEISPVLVDLQLKKATPKKVQRIELETFKLF